MGITPETEGGRVLTDQALVASDGAASVSTLAGFDPSRFAPRSYDGKPRNLSREHSRALGEFIQHIDRRIDEMTPEERRLLLDACFNVSPINCAWDKYAMAGIVVWHLQETAIAMEAAAAGETVGEQDQ